MIETAFHKIVAFVSFFVFLVVGHEVSAMVSVMDSVVVRHSADSADLLLPNLEESHFLQDKTESTIVADSVSKTYADSLHKQVGDTLRLNRFQDWKPDPIRAMWLAMVLPGGGQIYNRKYWKLPIVYGGVVGCVYAVSWNSTMLRDYSQAYQDIMDSDPTTNSHKEMLPIGYDITGREEHFKTVFKRKKDFYRRNRDLSIFCIAGVYLLSIMDAYVDAELSTFDIGQDLTLYISPGMISSSDFGLSTTLLGTLGITFQLHF